MTRDRYTGSDWRGLPSRWKRLKLIIIRHIGSELSRCTINDVDSRQHSGRSVCALVRSEH